MIKNRYQGDPKIYLDFNGSYLNFKSGQPVMEQGFENYVNLKLFTSSSWWGNSFLNESSKIGSNFLKETKKPITVNTINNLVRIIQKTLNNQAFGKIEVIITNPTSINLKIIIKIHQPNQSIQEFIFNRNFLNWAQQITQESEV